MATKPFGQTMKDIALFLNAVHDLKIQYKIIRRPPQCTLNRNTSTGQQNKYYKSSFLNKYKIDSPEAPISFTINDPVPASEPPSPTFSLPRPCLTSHTPPSMANWVTVAFTLLFSQWSREAQCGERRSCLFVAAEQKHDRKTSFYSALDIWEYWNSC